MGDAVWLADVLRAAGLNVAEVDGWQTRRRAGSPATLDPQVVVGHHTAGAAQGDMPSLGVLVGGRADLPGPLCNVGLSRSGTYYVVAAGPSNNAGPGSWEGISSNYRTLGIEAENTGVGEAWPDVQVHAYIVGAAAMLGHLGLGAGRFVRHQEWTPTKIDPRDLDGPWLREQIGAAMGELGSGVPLVTPIPAAEPVAARRTLYRRTPYMTGDDVGSAQAMAAGVTGLPLKLDKVYGPATEAVVRAYQRIRRLVPDGIVGPATWADMDQVGNFLAGLANGQPHTPAPARPRATLSKTNPGPGLVVPDVQDLQGRLAILGYPVGRIDGRFGDQTATAVEAYQRDHGLGVDGIVGPETWASLG